MAPRKKKEVSAEVVPVDVAAEVEPVRSEYVEILAFVSSVNLEARGLVFDEELSGLEALGRFREAARLKLKEVEARRTGITSPMLEAKRKVDELFKPATDSLKAVVSTCTTRLEEHARTIESARAKALAEMNAVGIREDLVAVATAPVALPAEVHARHDFSFEVVDITAVPEKYLIVNEARVLADIRATGGVVPIPGIQIHRVVKVSA